MIKWLICTISTIFVILLSFIGGCALFFIAQEAFTGVAVLSSANKMMAIITSIAVNIVLYGAMVW